MTATGDGTSLADRKRRAGQRLVIGFAGTTVTPELRELVREIRPGGFILFARNVADPVQVAELNRALSELLPADRPPLRTVDQEGGRVQRVRAPATEWPAMRVVGAAAEHTAAVATAMGRELRAMGFDLDFAPVADVDSNPDNPVIGDRSFAREARRVGIHVSTFVMALQATGVMACAKHVPGHGDTDTDSHLELPIVRHDDARLREVELPPFRAAARAGVASMMSAHVLYPAWDPEWPATLSPAILDRIVRGEIGFDRVIFTDDLEMKAVADRYDTATKVRQTWLSTVDLALACHDPALQLELFGEMVRQQESDRAIERLAVHSAGRVEALKARLARREPAPGLEVVGSSAHQQLAEEVREAARKRAMV